ncbi:MAG: hypothetical protein V8T29_09005 [Oscillospiraceae bacterium]
MPVCSGHCDPGTTIAIGHNAKTPGGDGPDGGGAALEGADPGNPHSKGRFFEINPGCLHAIKGGTLILETQQSSDVTYRFYDYDRLSDGKPRPLHIAQNSPADRVPIAWRRRSRRRPAKAALRSPIW